MLQASVVVDIVTWGLLWPMLSRSPDPKRVAFFRSQFFSWTSYNTVRGPSAWSDLWIVNDMQQMISFLSKVA